MNYKDMWLELRHRLKELQEQAGDSLRLMAVDGVVELMEEIESKVIIKKALVQELRNMGYIIEVYGDIEDFSYIEIYENEEALKKDAYISLTGRRFYSSMNKEICLEDKLVIDLLFKYLAEQA